MYDLVLRVRYMTKTNLRKIETYSIHVSRARKVSFAGSGWRELHDGCVAKQEQIIAVIDIEVLHHYFDNPPIFKGGQLLGVAYTLP